MPSIDWGSVPDWLAGAGAVTALWWARRAAKAARATNDQQARQIESLEKDRSRAEADRKSQQAECIAVWCDARILEKTNPFQGKPGRQLCRVVQVRNSSQLPVYIPSIYIEAPGYGIFEMIEPDMPIPPAIEPRALELKLDAIARENRSRPLSVGIFFRDIRNQFWHRGPDGALEGLPEAQYFSSVETVREQCQGASYRPHVFDD